MTESKQPTADPIRHAACQLPSWLIFVWASQTKLRFRMKDILNGLVLS